MDCRLITDNSYIIGTAHDSRNADVTVAEPSVDSLITSRGVGTAQTQKTSKTHWHGWQPCVLSTGTQAQRARTA